MSFGGKQVPLRIENRSVKAKSSTEHQAADTITACHTSSERLNASLFLSQRGISVNILKRASSDSTFKKDQPVAYLTPSSMEHRHWRRHWRAPMIRGMSKCPSAGLSEFVNLHSSNRSITRQTTTWRRTGAVYLLTDTPGIAWLSDDLLFRNSFRPSCSDYFHQWFGSRNYLKTR